MQEAVKWEKNDRKFTNINLQNQQQHNKQIFSLFFSSLSQIHPCCFYMVHVGLWCSLQRRAHKTKCGIIYACTRCDDIQSLCIVRFYLYLSLFPQYYSFLHNRRHSRSWFVCYSHRKSIHILFYTKCSAPNNYAFIKWTAKKRRNSTQK